MPHHVKLFESLQIFVLCHFCISWCGKLFALAVGMGMSDTIFNYFGFLSSSG